MIEIFTAGWQIVLIVAAIAGAAVWLRSQLQKQRTAELEKLAETRGERNKDLEAEIEELRQEMAELRGEMKFLRDLKTEEIAAATAQAVVGELLPFLRGD